VCLPGDVEEYLHQATLVLEDGTVFEGQAFGALGEATGEVIFNTSMSGYQEVLTDPSYRGQLVTMTAPQIGNTGINPQDAESARLWMAGFIVREASPRTSNWRSTLVLDTYLREHGIVGMTGAATRAIVRHIRSRGAMRAILSSVNHDVGALLVKTQAIPSMTGLDLVKEVTCQAPYSWSEKADRVWYPGDPRSAGHSGPHHVVADPLHVVADPPHVVADPPHVVADPLHVVAYDFGTKWNILRLLANQGFRVTVVPATTSAQTALALLPDGIFLSNGPGDPAAVTYAVDTIRALLGKVPVFGICLGHQLLGLALGGQTYKLKFGHRGSNQPVKNLLTGRVEITTHNHGFAVDADSLPPEVEITHINLNDRCVEGLRHQSLQAFSVQYHPEAAPGPHDAAHLFDSFRRLMEHAQEKATNHAKAH